MVSTSSVGHQIISDQTTLFVQIHPLCLLELKYKGSVPSDTTMCCMFRLIRTTTGHLYYGRLKNVSTLVTCSFFVSGSLLIYYCLLK